MKWLYCLAWTTLLGAASQAAAQSNIDATYKYAWQENVGWTNWRDANAGTQGVVIGGRVMAGYIWAENVGWISVGDGSPTSGLYYANADASDFGVNIDPDGDLYGYAWGENIGWINFDGGALAAPEQPANITCDGRLHGYAWGENVGWLNLDDVTRYVSLQASAVPADCDMNHDGQVDGLDVQTFTSFLLSADESWRDVCSGDLEATPDRQIDLADLTSFVSCLLDGP